VTAARPVAAVAAAAGLLLAGLAAPAAGAEPCPDEVGVRSAIVIEVSTGEPACERRPGLRRPVGSTVKLMTALITLERADLSDTFTASDYRPAPVESQIGLEPGERMSVRDLLRGLLMASGNDAAMTLAEGVAGSERAFVRLMNRRARELGLDDTRYGNPIGLDEPRAHSSARDLVKLAVVLRSNRFFRRTVDAKAVTLRTGVRPRRLGNRNTALKAAEWVNGVKTGYTSQAGEVLVGSGRRNGIQVVSAVLGAPTKAERDADTLALLRFGLRGFQRITAAPEGTRVDVSVPIRYRRGAEIELVVGPNGERTVVPRSQRDRVTIEPKRWPTEVEGPIAAGTKLGSADVLQDGRRIGTVPLVTASDVPAADLAQRTKSWFTTPVGVLLGLAALSGTVLLARRRRRPGGPRRRRRREEAGLA
jgi:D-alanyl-D-alanine carboxypeptidase (penicillin-binding protein 5/6)